MSRRPRRHFVNGMYHVMLRGNYRQNIFLSNADRDYFYKRLAIVVNKFSCKIHLFCLMSNHVHLVIEVKHVPLSKIVQSITSTYANWHNKAHNKMGHLFQGRYLALLIQNDRYLLELCHYIHRNPVKAGIVEDPDDYIWSSHRNYCGGEQLEWLTTNHINTLLMQHVEKSTEVYKTFIKERAEYYKEPQFCEFDENGDIIITDSVNANLNKDHPHDSISIKLSKIMSTVCDYMNVSESDLASQNLSRRVVCARAMIAYFGHYYANYYIKDIAILFNLRPASVSNQLHKMLGKLNKEKKLKNLMEGLKHELLLSDLDD